MKETGWIKPGVEGRDERDADNTCTCNIDEETEGKRRRVEWRLQRQSGATSDLFSGDTRL